MYLFWMRCRKLHLNDSSLSLCLDCWRSRPLRGFRIHSNLPFWLIDFFPAMLLISCLTSYFLPSFLFPVFIPTFLLDKLISFLPSFLFHALLLISCFTSYFMLYFLFHALLLISCFTSYFLASFLIPVFIPTFLLD